MVFLHPVFTAVFIFMALVSVAEVSGNTRYSRFAMFLVGAALIILSGLRNQVGADFGNYRVMYETYFQFMVDFGKLFEKALFGQNEVELEWLYGILNKVFFLATAGAPFYFFTLFIAILLIVGKFTTIFRNSDAPVFALMFYFIPTFFISDSGHMRQALAMTVTLMSFRFIKERKVLWYLLCMYVAFGFHKSSIIFLPAYWFATVNLNPRKMVLLIAISILLSPLQLYNYLSGVLDTVAVQDISAGFNGYIVYEMEEPGIIKFMDILSMYYAMMMLLYDKEACRNIPYYEYMRNIGVLGICIYFVMRMNPVFSTRLVAPYFLYMGLIVSNIIISIPNMGRRQLQHIAYLCFAVFYYFVFASMQGRAGSFTPDLYHNHLW